MGDDFDDGGDLEDGITVTAPSTYQPVTTNFTNLGNVDPIYTSNDQLNAPPTPGVDAPSAPIGGYLTDTNGSTNLSVPGVGGGGAGNLASLIGGLGSTAGGLYGLSQGNNLASMANAAFAAANPFGQYRAQYGAQLSALMANPSSITSDPGYQSSLNTGIQAVTRGMSAQGFKGSGNEAVALDQYGMNFANTYLQQQETNLYNMAGGNLTPNYSAGLSGAAAAAGINSGAVNGLNYGLTSLANAAAGTTPTTAGTPASTGSGLYGTAPVGVGNPGSFSSAGGEAAEAGQAIGLAKTALGTDAGLTKLAGGTVDPSVTTAQSVVGAAGNALGIYEGIEQGGVRGDLTTATSAASLANKAYGGAVSTGLINASSTGAEVSADLTKGLGVAGAALATYNFVADEKPGQTGGDTLRGAEAGASIGSIIPGVGTIIGGVVGGVVGAVSSLFGSTDTTKRSWQEFANNQDGVRQDVQTNPNDLISSLGGLWRSADGNFPGIKNYPDANKFVASMADTIAGAVQSGQISPTANASQIYSQVVQPWLLNMPGGSNWSKSGVQSQEGQLVEDLVSNYIQGKPINQYEVDGQKAPDSYTSFADAIKSPTPISNPYALPTTKAPVSPLPAYGMSQIRPVNGNVIGAR